MTDIELKAIRDSVYQMKTYVPAAEHWRTNQLERDIDRLLLYVRLLQGDSRSDKRAGFRNPGD